MFKNFQINLLATDTHPFVWLPACTLYIHISLLAYLLQLIYKAITGLHRLRKKNQLRSKQIAFHLKAKQEITHKYKQFQSQPKLRVISDIRIRIGMEKKHDRSF